jgi:hypothetical protein
MDWPRLPGILTFAAMRSILILFFITFVTLSNAQVVNSLSKDTTGFYGHALDSVISIVKENKALRAVYVGGKECVKSYLPDTLQGVVVKWKPPKKSKKEKLKLKKDEMLVAISCLSIIRDEVIVVIYAAREGDQMYRFQYYYQSDTMDYKLKKVDRGMRL